MKLIVTGATGLVGSEVIKQSLLLKEITSVVAVARQPIALDQGVDASKLKSVVVKDYAEYSDSVKDEFAEADACIWTVAVTPFKARSMDFAEVKRVCDDCTMAGFKAIYESVPAKPFRFFYFSGDGVPEDPKKKPLILGDYLVMRSEVEQKVLALPKEYEDVQVAVAQPGIITTTKTWARSAVQAVYSVNNILGRHGFLTNITTSQVAAAALHQVLHGFEKERLSNDELVHIGQEALKKAS